MGRRSKVHTLRGRKIKKKKPLNAQWQTDHNHRQTRMQQQQQQQHSTAKAKQKQPDPSFSQVRYCAAGGSELSLIQRVGGR